MFKILSFLYTKHIFLTCLIILEKDIETFQYVATYVLYLCDYCGTS